MKWYRIRNYIRNLFIGETRRKKDLKDLCLNYFSEHLEQKKVFINKGIKSKEQEWKENNKKSHLFGSYLGEIRCLRCKCSEKDDADLYECPIGEYICGIDGWETHKRKVNMGAYNPYYIFTTKTVEKIKSVLVYEEDLYSKAILRGKNLCKKKWDDISQITGADLSWLRHTHGIDLETIEGIYEESLSLQQKKDYEVEYEKHKAIGRLGFTAKVIEVCS